MDSVPRVKRNRPCAEVREDHHSEGEGGQSSCHSELKQTWPLYLPVGPVGTLTSFPAKKRRDCDVSSTCSSGYLPSSSSCGRQSSCSSPFSSTGISIGPCSSYDDLDETIRKAESYARSYQDFTGLPVVVKKSQDAFDDCLGSQDLEQKPAARENSQVAFFSIGADPMAQVLTFLEPAEILRALTMPLCKTWRDSYTSHQDLWRVLCLTDPFNANVHEDDGDDDLSSCDSDSFCSLGDYEPAVNNIFGKSSSPSSS